MVLLFSAHMTWNKYGTKLEIHTYIVSITKVLFTCSKMLDKNAHFKIIYVYTLCASMKVFSLEFLSFLDKS